MAPSGLTHEKLITLAEAARLFPGRPHAAAAWRACRRGVLARTGERVRLEHIRSGGRIFTTAEAVGRFHAALTAADLEHFGRAAGEKPRPQRRRRSRERAKALAAAASRLDEAQV